MAILNGKEIFPNLRHIRISNINQNNGINAESVETQLIELLYTLAYKSEYVQNNIQFSSNNDDFSGIIKVTASYKDYINYLTVYDENNNHFNPHLTIQYSNGYILFEDPQVEEIIVNDYINRWFPNLGYTGVIENLQLDMTGNQNNLGFRKIFRENKNITSFDELSQLTYALALALEEFKDTHNLISIDLTNVEFIGQDAFRASGLEWFHGKKDDPNEKGILNLGRLRSNGLQGGAFSTYNVNSVWRGPKIKKIISLGQCQTIGNNTFMQCQTLESIDDSIFNNLTSIGWGAFQDCPLLTIDDLQLPNVSTIGGRAFRNTKIKKISVLKPSVEILEEAFANCTSLTSISTWSAEDVVEDETRTIALQNISKLGNYAFRNDSLLVINDLKMPLLTSIGTGAFENTGVVKVSDLGNTIETITGFKDCKSLTSVTIPNKVNKIGENAFSGCTSLIIPDNMFTKYAYFDNGCFYGITRLPYVLYLPKVTTNIGWDAFRDTNVESIYLPYATHTRGLYGKDWPSPLTNPHRGGDWRYGCGSSMHILYYKNLEEVCNGAFSGNVYSDYFCYDTRYGDDIRNNPEYYRMYDGTKLPMFNNDSPERGGKPFPVNSTRKLYIESGKTEYGQMGFSGVYYSNIKYLVINNTTPPISYFAYNGYNYHRYGGVGIWGSNADGSKYSFKYLVVPKSAIETYKTWQALRPNIDMTDLDPNDKNIIINQSTFDIANIIALETMPHVATKADWDAIDNSNEFKYDYLIEEYMGLTDEQLAQIQWETPIFRSL